MISPFRLYGAILLLLLEMFFLSILVDASTISRESLIGKLLSSTGDVLRWIIVSAGLLTIYFTQTKEWTRNRISDNRPIARVIAIFVLHCVLFVLVAILTFQLFQTNNRVDTTEGILWITLLAAVAITWCFILVGAKKWSDFLRQEKWSCFGIGLAALVIVIAGTFFQQFWRVLNLFTLSGTRTVLELFYNNIYFEYAERKLGVPEFWVTIDSACSGIEGIVIAISTTAIYLFLSRKELRFPQALALIPIACLFSVGLNILRIAALISIGIEISPKLAIEGFHSVAGWLAAVIVALIIIFIFTSWKWVQRPVVAPDTSLDQENDHVLAIAILTPFALFVGLTLFGRIFSSEFEYLYPLKITITSIAIAYYWKSYQLRLPNNYLEVTIASVLAASVWIALSDYQPQVDQDLVASVTEMSQLSAVIWLLLRTISFWMIVPIFEELLFRGYLMSRLAGYPIDNNRKLPFHWVSLLVSSVLFGLIHDAWIAGIAAGVIFGWLRFRSISLTSCLFAHGLTNILISFWALFSGRWSLI